MASPIISKEEFEELSEECQNVFIARDIKLRLEMGQFNAFRRLYIRKMSDDPQEAYAGDNLIEGETLPVCVGCAKGAAYYSRCMIANNGRAKSVDWGDPFGDASPDVFGSRSERIEEWFEAGSKTGYGSKFQEAADALEAIADDLIKHNGRFTLDGRETA